MLRAELDATREAQWDTLRHYITSYAARQPVQRVTVVGNAPLAPSAERAAAIDAADLVIRVNAFVLDRPGEQPASGTACHAVLLSRAAVLTPWTLQNHQGRAYLVPQAGWVQWQPGDDVGLHPRAGFWPADLGAMPLPNAVVKARLVRALDLTARPGSVIPTTGTTAVFLAHEMFPDADLVATGFSLLDDQTQKTFAHHDGTVTKVNWQHRLDLEAALLQSWIADGSLRMLN